MLNSGLWQVTIIAQHIALAVAPSLARAWCKHSRGFFHALTEATRQGSSTCWPTKQTQQADPIVRCNNGDGLAAECRNAKKVKDSARFLRGLSCLSSLRSSVILRAEVSMAQAKYTIPAGTAVMVKKDGYDVWLRHTTVSECCFDKYVDFDGRFTFRDGKWLLQVPKDSVQTRSPTIPGVSNKFQSTGDESPF